MIFAFSCIPNISGSSDNGNESIYSLYAYTLFIEGIMYLSLFENLFKSFKKIEIN